MTVFIIAEAGVNHNGSITDAHKLVMVAKQGGANACKFQLFDPVKLEPPGPRRDMLAGLTLTRPEHAALKAQCDAIGLEYLCTPFDVESLEFLVRLGVKRLKISSGQYGNTALLLAAHRSRLPVIVSTGMLTQAEIFEADLMTDRATWLHCLSAYPAPPGDMNLRAMTRLPEPYGLSDHTLGNTAAIAATALGASVIEKHITLDRTLEGPDHHMSTEPDEFALYVKAIRECEAMLGDGVKRLTPSELKTLEIVKEREAWRSLTA
jgi:N,N'-diacetyllegionaminate synthase